MSIPKHIKVVREPGNLTPVEIESNTPFTVAVLPGEGGSAALEFTLSTNEALKAGTAVWHQWSLGEVSEATVDFFPSPVNALRVVALIADCTLEICQ